MTSSTKSRPTSTYILRYLNISGFGLVPKNTHTKFMVSWLLGRFVPESKPSCFFFTRDALLSFSKELKFHSYSTIRGIRRNGSLEHCTLFRNYSDSVEIETIGSFLGA